VSIDKYREVVAAAIENDKALLTAVRDQLEKIGIEVKLRFTASYGWPEDPELVKRAGLGLHAH
jgi:uncharacterized protein (UPF0371 family)